MELGGELGVCYLQNLRLLSVADENGLDAGMHHLEERAEDEEGDQEAQENLQGIPGPLRVLKGERRKNACGEGQCNGYCIP